MTVAWALGLYLPARLYGGIGPMFERIAAVKPQMLTMPGLDASGAPWSWGAYSSTMLSSAIGFVVWPHIFMKAFASRDDRTLRRTVVLYPTFQLFLVPLVLVGFAGILYGSAPDKPDSIMPHMVLTSGLPAVLVGLFCAGALAASMSTGDALLHGAASIAVEDGLRPFVHFSDRLQTTLMRVLVLAVGALAFYLAIVQKRTLVWLLITAYGLIDQLAPAVYAALYWRRATTPGVLAGLVAGAATNIFFLLRPELRPFQIHEGILGLMVNVALLVVVSRATAPQEEGHVREFVEPVETRAGTAAPAPAGR